MAMRARLPRVRDGVPPLTMEASAPPRLEERDSPTPQPEHGEPKLGDPSLRDFTLRDWLAIFQRADELALLFGGEMNAEVERTRELRQDRPAEDRVVAPRRSDRPE
jgi:hypothetical protein